MTGAYTFSFVKCKNIFVEFHKSNNNQKSFYKAHSHFETSCLPVAYFTKEANQSIDHQGWVSD